jgi:hypothetical protein
LSKRKRSCFVNNNNNNNNNKNNIHAPVHGHYCLLLVAIDCSFAKPMSCTALSVWQLQHSAVTWRHRMTLLLTFLRAPTRNKTCNDGNTWQRSHNWILRRSLQAKQTIWPRCVTSHVHSQQPALPGFPTAPEAYHGAAAWSALISKWAWLVNYVGGGEIRNTRRILVEQFEEEGPLGMSGRCW